ncbi:MAG TPA: APC family permease, partial [Candidatus Saccharimonadia bacterium]|nr:APC family permease [Candidatus Saccharimonadia bacterium]
WKVSLNFSLGGRELPLGLSLITVLLFAVAGVNLLTKQVATISGAAFTLVFFSLFLVSEWLSERRRGQAHVEVDQFQLQLQEDVSAQTLEVQPRNILCTVRDYNNLAHVQRVLERTDTSRQDVVVMTVRLLQGPSTGYRDIDERELFTTYEQRLFSRVVALAEKVGKHVALLVVPSLDIFQATVLTAAQLGSVEIVAGRSAVLAPAQQARQLGRAWEQVPNRPRRQLRFRVIAPDSKTHVFYLGAHTPQLAEDDVELIHRLWLDLTQASGKESAHHRDVVHLALTHLADDLTGPAHDILVTTFAARPMRRIKAQQGDRHDDGAGAEA